MDIALIIKVAVLVFGGMAAVSFFKLSMAIFRADKSEYGISRARTRSWYKPIFGDVQTYHDGYRDFRVQAGLAVDKKTNTWKGQGILSEESIDSILKP